jgi:nucleoside phosphorylase
MYPCVLFALHREAQPFYRQYRKRQRLEGAPCPAWLCGDSLGRVLVLESGVGAERCEAALRWLTESYLPSKGFLQPLWLCAAGFAGALQADWRIGDVLVALEVADTSGRCWLCDPWLEAQPGGLWREGRLLSTVDFIAAPHDKGELGRRYGAAAVDMESATAAQFCLKRNIPFVGVRAISDELHTRLSPRLATLLSGPAVRPGRVLAAVLRSPGLLPELWRLARDTRRAARSLAHVLLRLLGDKGPRRRDSHKPQGMLLG